MNAKQIYLTLKDYPELLGNLIISDINGESVPSTEIKKYTNIDKLLLIQKNYSCYCPSCSEYNEGQKLKKCNSCDKNLGENFDTKYTTKVYNSAKRFVIKPRNKIRIIFENCLLEEIRNENLVDEKTPILHISPYFKIKNEFQLHKLNLNHVFLDWNSTFKLFNEKQINLLVNRITDFIYEEKNRTIIWKKINDKIFPKLSKDLLELEGHKNCKFGGEGPDQGKDILSNFKNKKWLTQCKFYLKDSVSANEIATVDWLATHNCKCYRLSALKLSGSLVTKINNLDGKFGLKTDFWDEEHIRNLLVKNDHIRRKYFEK